MTICFKNNYNFKTDNTSQLRNYLLGLTFRRRENIHKIFSQQSNF